MSRYIHNRLAFIDTETLGSDKPTTPVIEIAILVTDFALKPLQAKSWIFPHAIDGVHLSQIDPYVLKMHSDNGLWKDLIEAQNRFPTSIIWDQVRDWLRHATGWYQSQADHNVLVAGSGFDHFDRPIIERQAPGLAQMLTYYSLDIGTAERILRILADIGAEEVETDHRAMTCVQTQATRMRRYVGAIQRAFGIPAELNVLLDQR